jgi:hypothetical protein
MNLVFLDGDYAGPSICNAPQPGVDYGAPAVENETDVKSMLESVLSRLDRVERLLTELTAQLQK